MIQLLAGNKLSFAKNFIEYVRYLVQDESVKSIYEAFDPDWKIHIQT